MVLGLIEVPPYFVSFVLQSEPAGICLLSALSVTKCGEKVKSAINNTGKLILKDHIEHCIVHAAKNDDEEAIHQLEEAIDKFMK